MQKEKGFTLLIAILITSMVLIVSFAVVNVAVKQLVLSNSNEESQYAFYNADSGVECAVYWDFKDGVSSFDPNAVSPNTITCNNQDFTVGGVPSNATSTFRLNLSTGCVDVSVGKHSNNITIIDSRGYNTCSGTSLRRLERGQKLTYQSLSGSGGGGGGPVMRLMTITFSGTGSGTVSGNGNACAPTCSFPDGTPVTFTAVADGSSSFTGWFGGGCSGSGACDLTMDSDRSTTATFTSSGSTGILGYNTIGGDTDSSDRNSNSASRYTMPVGVSGTATSISVYVPNIDPNPANRSYQVAIYAHNSGSNTPAARIAQSAVGTLVSGWNTIPISAPLSANTTYWLAYNTNASADNFNNFNMDSAASPARFVWRSQTFGTMPNPFGSPDGNAGINISIYVTYSIP